MPAGPFGQPLDEALPGRRRLVVGAGATGAQHGVDDLLQVALGHAAGTVAIRHHLALLGEAQAAGDGVVRLGEDGVVGGAAAAADGAAAAVEDLNADAGSPPRVPPRAPRL